MRSGVVDIWTTRNDSIRIDRRVASIIMLLDVFHVDSATHSGDLEDVFRIIE